MGLELDIRNALINNLGKEHYDAGNTGQKAKVDTLALDLKNAIINFIVKQDFNITEMVAPVSVEPGHISVIGGTTTPGTPAGLPVTITPTAPAKNALAAAGTAQISETSNQIFDGRVPGAVKTSKVKLLSVFPESD